MILVEDFLQKVNDHPPRCKIYFEDREYTYSQLVAKSYDLARLIESYKYKKLFFNLTNSPLTICLYLAGCISDIELIVFFKPGLVNKELEIIVEPNSIFVTNQNNIEPKEFYQQNNIQILKINNEIKFLDNIPKTKNFQIFSKAIIAHLSSGTTQFYQKHSHKIIQIINYADYQASDLGLKKNDHLLIALSMNHAFAFSYQLLPALAMGLSVTIMKEFNSRKIAQIISKSKITALALLPTMYHFLIKENITKHRLRYLSVAGDLTSEKIYKFVKKKLGLPLLNGIGMTEVFGYGQNICEDIAPNVVKIFDDTKIKIINFKNCDYGKIFIKNLMLPINSKNNNWLETGDIGSFDNQTRRLNLYGRYKDIIIKGGSNIPPAELENIILKLHIIKSCAVVGKKDKIWGEIICAIIVSEDRISLDKLNHHLLQYLSKYKKIDMLFNIEEIPLTTTGKINRQKLKKIVENK